MLSFDVIVLQNFESPLCSQQYDICDQTSEAAKLRDLQPGNSGRNDNDESEVILHIY